MGFDVNLRHMKRMAVGVAEANELYELAYYMEIPEHLIALQAKAPAYYSFRIPKADGSWRLIEAPEKELMEMLKKLNFLLQCVYYFVKPVSSYGYIPAPKGDDNPRNMLTNAEQHLNCQYLLNVDFEDFFHQFTTERVFNIFIGEPFQFSYDAAEVLSRLCTYGGRLPMGSPTSPVLSNLGTMALDLEIESRLNERNICFTRFVDDLSFSSQHELGNSFLMEMNECFQEFGFSTNEEKIKWYGPVDNKIVTGLEVSNVVRIPGSFFYELSQDLNRLRHTVEASAIMEGSRPSAFIDKFKQQVAGKLNFIAMIYGYNDDKYQDYLEQYETAVHPEVEKLSLRWTEFPYQSF